MDCTIIIPHHHQVDQLEICLRALIDQQTTVNYEIIVVDVDGKGRNYLNNETYDGRVTWIETPKKNPYISRNLGIVNSRGEVIILLDVKCRAAANFVTSAYEALSKSPRTVYAGQYELEFASALIKDKVYGALYLQPRKNIRHKYGVTAGNMAFTKQLFDSVGPFDESYHSGMDIKWSQQVWSMGFDIAYLSMMKVYYPAQSWDELKESVKKYFCGISHIHRTQEMGFGSRLMYLIKQFLPMRISTYKLSLSSRPLVHTAKDKVYLWLRVWQAKIYMATAYLRCWMKHEDRP